MAQLITKEILNAQFKDDMMNGKKVMVKNPVNVVEAKFGSAIPVNGSMLDDSSLGLINSANRLGRSGNIQLSGKYENGLDYVFGKRGSVIDRIRKGVFTMADIKTAFAGTGNTLNDNWSDLIDAIRMDLSIKKMANQTVRQFIYSELQMPNATKDIRPSELYPYGVVFEENNGEGQAVRQGANMGGAVDTIPMKIYAAGFVWTLLAALFDGTYDLSRLTEGVALAYAAKRDDLAISPILADVYSTVGTAKWTAASTVGTLRQELLLNTVLDAVDDLGDRVDPITGRKIVAENLVAMGTAKDMRHLQSVMSGLGTVVDKYPGISQITKLIGYEGETIDMPGETVTYDGCTDGIIHIIKPSRYFKIPIKRNLVMEIDMQPNVNTLAQEQRAWYFSESIYNSIGISDFVQKVTLPTW
jgi:hypothetical protein